VVTDARRRSLDVLDADDVVPAGHPPERRRRFRFW
jgi:hypothetical protein